LIGPLGIKESNHAKWWISEKMEEAILSDPQEVGISIAAETILSDPYSVGVNIVTPPAFS